jgi:thiol-disulfide isomerase/thioredoxin
MRNSLCSLFLVGLISFSCFSFVSAESNDSAQNDEWVDCFLELEEGCDYYHGPLIGGLSLPTNNSSYVSNIHDESYVDLPIIAEDYTATWCENCVEVEEALDQLAAEMSMTQLHFHKCCLGEGEYEDPLGTLTGDEWWSRRNGQKIQPMVVINGGEPVVGSVAGTYDNFKALAENKIEYTTYNAQGNAINVNQSLEWEPSGNSTGIVTWKVGETDEETSKINTSSLIPENYNPSIYMSLFVVEDSIYFPDGSNGLENYHYVVRDIIGLGNMSGETEITLPEIYDGDDLSLVLVLEINGWKIIEKSCGDCSNDDDDSSMLPNVSVSMTLVCLMGAAFSRSYIRKFD